MNRDHFGLMANPLELKFNQVIMVGCVLTPKVGRVVQVRKGVGQFGSDIVFVRFSDGSLSTVENASYYPVKTEFEGFYLNQFEDFDDQANLEYTISGKFPETGFLVLNPTHPNPNRVDSFGISIRVNT